MAVVGVLPCAQFVRRSCCVPGFEMVSLPGVFVVLFWLGCIFVFRSGAFQLFLSWYSRLFVVVTRGPIWVTCVVEGVRRF